MTNLKEAQSYRLFDMLDLDKSGQMEFDEFYVLMCILIAIKVRTRPPRGSLAPARPQRGWSLAHRTIVRRSSCSSTRMYVPPAAPARTDVPRLARGPAHRRAST